MTLFGFNVLEECDPISIDCTLKDNHWKAVWRTHYDFWYADGDQKPGEELLSWLQNETAIQPVISKVGDADNGRAGTIAIWIQPDDYVLYVLKFR